MSDPFYKEKVSCMPGQGLMWKTSPNACSADANSYKVAFTASKISVNTFITIYIKTFKGKHHSKLRSNKGRTKPKFFGSIPLPNHNHGRECVFTQFSEVFISKFRQVLLTFSCTPDCNNELDLVFEAFISVVRFRTSRKITQKTNEKRQSAYSQQRYPLLWQFLFQRLSLVDRQHQPTENQTEEFPIRHR